MMPRLNPVDMTGDEERYYVVAMICGYRGCTRLACYEVRDREEIRPTVSLCRAHAEGVAAGRNESSSTEDP